jgi:hypothetical protein
MMAKAVKKSVKTKSKTKTATRPVKRAVGGKVDAVNVRMYRGGTGDCFLLQCKKAGKVTFNIMIDCGCINGGRADFEPWIKDIKDETDQQIDLLIVTHEHADHINGFQKCADLWNDFDFKRVWFAWTENEEDPLANDLRENHSKLKMALASATANLTGLLQNKYYQQLFSEEINSALMARSKETFITSLDQVNGLNINAQPAARGKIPSMVELFHDTYNVIKEGTEVECHDPGVLVHDLPGAEGLRFYILGPPRSAAQMSVTERAGENYEKREEKSTTDFAFAAAATGDTITRVEFRPFETTYEVAGKAPEAQARYKEGDNQWRNIDNDWLFTAGSLALRFERSINNTSLALAIQFEDSERVMLFPGDAEFGNWESWRDATNKWTVKVQGENKTVNATYLLNNAVFYKIGHHCSQNGSASRLGIEMMTHEDLAAMATLNFDKINSGWLNTMPNDLVGAALISKSKGKLFFNGDCATILPNIKTDRVTVKKANEKIVTDLNAAFDGKIFIDYEVEG